MIWLGRVLLAATIVLCALFSVSALGLDEQLWLGAQTLGGHGVATTLGRETFSAPGSPSGAFGWLADALEALVARVAGTRGLALVSACAIVAALALVEIRARRQASELLAFGAAALAAATFLGNIRSGGGGLDWLVAAAFVAAITAKGRGATAGAVALAILWCNVSATGFFAPWIALCVALGRTLDENASAPAARTSWFAFAGCVLALFVTPAGRDFVALASLALHLAGTPAPPNGVAPLAYRLGFSACLLIATFFGLRGCARGDIFATLAILVVALVDGHQLPLLGIVAAPVLAQAAQSALTSEAALAGRSFAFGLLAILALGAWSAARASASDAVPSAILDGPLQAGGREHRILCTRLEWCGSAVAAGDAHLAVFMDEREAAYPAKVRAEQHSMATGTGSWRSSVRRNAIDAVIVDRHATLAGLLELGDGWSRAAEQGDVRLYLRTSGPR